jgi:ABC-type Fe3+ transport system permease subunit
MVVALRRAHAGRWGGGSLVMLVSGVLWLACLVASWWPLSGVDLEATASLQAQRAAMAWVRSLLLGALGAFVTFWIAFGVTVIRRSAGTKTA